MLQANLATTARITSKHTVIVKCGLRDYTVWYCRPETRVKMLFSTVNGRVRVFLSLVPSPGNQG